MEYTYQERTRAFCSLLNAELPVTWNWPFPTAVTAGAVAPREPVNVWRFWPLAAAAELVAAAAACEEGRM